jgi:hypothetical protein
MPSGRLRSLGHRPALTVAAVGCILVLVGGLVLFVPYLARTRRSVAEVPSPPALASISRFAVAPGKEACMSSVAITPTSRVAQFRLRTRTRTAQAGARIELILRGSGYETRTRVAEGRTSPLVAVPIVAPMHALIGTACFANRGRTTVLLAGTTEPRTISRSTTRIAGRAVAGDIALAFLDDRRRSLLDRASEIIGHASNLTDGLVPVWLIWILAVLVAFGVPVGTMAAFYLAMTEDEHMPAAS